MKLKISRTGWWILAGGVFVVLMASLVMTYIGQQKEQSQLSEEQDMAQLRLASYSLDKLSAQQTEIENDLSQIESEIADARRQLEQYVESIPSTETLFDIAEDCEVEITTLSSSGISTGGALEKVSCSTLPIMVNAEGDVPALIAFVIKLNSDFKTGAVRSVNIVIPEDTTVELPVATIQMIIYSYQGD